MHPSPEDVLLLRPVHALDPSAVQKTLASVPGAFRHPTDERVWILPSVAIQSEDLQAELTQDPTKRDGNTRVRDGSPSVIEVIPGQTSLGAGRARKIVGALLEFGPFELEVRGEPLGVVRTPADIYHDNEWEDPDYSDDPTESPPRTGRLVTFYRDHPGALREYLAVHDSGVLSYEQRRPVDDEHKTYRRLSPDELRAFFALVAALQFEWEPGDEDGQYVDPAFISLEVPTGYVHDVKVDIARPSDAICAFVARVDGWATALRADRSATLPGMQEFDT